MTTDNTQRFTRLSPAKQQLLQAMLAKKAQTKRQTAVIPPHPPHEKPPLSFSQQRLWFINQFMPGNIAYNIAARLSLKGQLNRPALEASINQVIARHESLRTRFFTVEGQPYQHILPPEPLSLETVDLQSIAHQDEVIQEHINEVAKRPFDLSQEPLLRIRLLKQSQDEHLLIFAAHHIIFDQWSRGLFIQEIAATYKAAIQNTPLSLPPLTTQYADFAHWQRHHLAEQRFPAQLDYWQKQLAQPPPLLELPTDFPRPQTATLRGALYRFTWPQSLGQAVDKLGQTAQATRFMTLLAVFKCFLYHYTQQYDIIVGSPIANRNHPGLETIIGFFVNTLALRTTIEPTCSFMHLLRQVRQTTLEAYEHQDLPVEQLLDALSLDRSLSHPPLFQLLFAVQNAPTPPLELPGLWLESEMIETGAAKLDLTLAFETLPNGDLSGIVEYNTDLFTAETIARMMDGLREVVTAVIHNPHQPLAHISPVPAAARHTQLVTWNANTQPIDLHSFLHTRFAQLAAQYPHHPAVVDDERTLTYAALDQQANQLAHYLQRQGVQPESVVGVSLPKTATAIVAFLAVFKAGATYLPIDPGYPPERIRYILEDAQVQCLISNTAATPNSLNIEALQDELALMPVTPPTTTPHPSQLAYLIYTSGSTGQPKGVMVSHQGILNLVEAHIPIFDLKPGNQILQFTSFSFDVSVFEIAITLVAGGTLHLTNPDARLPGANLHQLLQQRQITHLILTTSLLALTPDHDLPHLKVVLVGGEACSAELVARWLNGRRFFHTYGPTEATVASTLTECHHADAAPPIGRPLPNTQSYILDPYLNPVPVGVTGELYIGGIGLARGYWQRPHLTAHSFIPHPFSHSPGARLYRTGDLARFRPDGNIEFVGRIDEQIKLHGFRIESGEIESALLREDGVIETAVAVHNQQLIAYVVGTADTAALRHALQNHLPHYMVPAHFIPLAQLPRTPTGKIDRRALPQPDATALTPTNGHVAPDTPTEKQLAQIWSDVLGLAQVGIHDNFFQLGGDSILSIQITARAAAVGLHLTPKQLFEQPTIAQLAPHLAQQEAIKIEQGETTGTLPLTPIQHWFFDQDFPNPHHFNQSIWLETSQPVSSEGLEMVLDTLVTYHDALRLRFTPTPEGWLQAYRPTTAVPILYRVDLSHLSPAAQDTAVQKAVKQHQTQLNITRGPLIRVLQVALGHTTRLLFIIHHLAIDGISWRILLGDFQTLYEQWVAKQPLQLPPKTTSYKYWAQQQIAYAQTEACLDQAAYWQQQINQPAPPLPLDYPDGQNSQASAATLSIILSPTETQALLQDVPQIYHTQINDILLTALVQALGTWTGQRQARIDLEGHGREEIDASINLSRTIGWFTTLYPVYLDLQYRYQLGEQIKHVKETLRQVPNKGFDYHLLKYLSHDPAITRALQSAPPAAISFNYFGQIEQGMAHNGRFHRCQYPHDPYNVDPQSRRPYLLIFNSDISQGQLQIRCTFSQNLHRPSTIQTLLQNYLFALRQLINHCQGAQNGVYTPSDFTQMDFSQDELDELVEEFDGTWN